MALVWRVGVEMTPAIFWDGVMGVLMMEAGLSSVSPGPARLKKPNNDILYMYMYVHVRTIGLV